MLSARLLNWDWSMSNLGSTKYDENRSNQCYDFSLTLMCYLSPTWMCNKSVSGTLYTTLLFLCNLQIGPNSCSLTTQKWQTLLQVGLICKLENKNKWTNVGKLITVVIYCHSMANTMAKLFYNTEWQYYNGMVVYYRGKKFYNIGPRMSWNKEDSINFLQHKLRS